MSEVAILNVLVGRKIHLMKTLYNFAIPDGQCENILLAIFGVNEICSSGQTATCSGKVQFVLDYDGELFFFLYFLKVDLNENSPLCSNVLMWSTTQR